ncbi:dTDP-4-dehydrorhamnose reductase [Cognatiluteimonas profundi]|uniref:dTDP-4-dehydrorhamnose reductase n=1 Tax=Cognatiluteimonas profundi TaxID=2594501 RepID=UPI00131A6A5C|nr:dTDP-4-dehydrorhamnose reductase [Lysobacter profundi]
MRILLLGGAGQLGTELRRSLAPVGALTVATRSGVLDDGTPCEQLDLDVPGALAPRILALAPDVVVNAAAYTAVDQAESDAATAWRVNADAPRAIADACAQCDAQFVHYSTDYVFDGRGTSPYREDDAVAPLGVYGASKRAGEEAVLDSGARHLVFRTAWVYAAHGRNFLRTMLRLANERDELRVVADQVGSPTPAALIADVTAQVLAQSPAQSGLWHLTAAGQTSWHGFAEAIIAGAHQRGLLARRPRVVPITTADFPTPAARPAYSVLDCHLLQSTFGITLPDWHDALGDVLDTMTTARA